MAKSPKKPTQATKKPATKTPKVRADVNTLAAQATGEAPKTPDPDAGKDPAAVSLGRRGGKARAKAMGKKARAASAKKAAAARWGTGSD